VPHFLPVLGLPQVLLVRSRGAFDSAEFTQFTDSIGMMLCFSSAEYPQSNGVAESAVKILKRLKAVSTGDNELFRALLYLQNIAKKGHTASQAEIFLGRTV
jgi:transposase InsO family protein